MVIFLLKFKKMDTDTLAMQRKPTCAPTSLSTTSRESWVVAFTTLPYRKTSPNNGKNDGIDSAATATVEYKRWNRFRGDSYEEALRRQRQG